MTSAGDVLDGVVCEVTPIGLIVQHDGLRFLIATHDLSWDSVSDASDFASVGDPIRFLVVRDLKENSDALNTGSRRRAYTKPNQWKPKSREQLQLVDTFAAQLKQLDYPSFRTLVESHQAELAFHALFELSTRGLGAEACTSANVLLDLNINCPISCVEIVRDIAMSTWNVSLEQLPWYAVKQFGLQHVRDCVATIRQESLTQDQWVLLDTIEYWAPLANLTPDPPVA
jgi:hypothetical protein